MQWFRVITNMSKAATTDFQSEEDAEQTILLNSEGSENVYLEVLKKENIISQL